MAGLRLSGLFRGNWAAPVFLGLCALLGGASAAGHVANLFVQLAGLTVIAWLIVAGGGEQTPHSRPLLLVCGTIIAVAVVQLVPIPLAMWRSLPPRDALAQALDLAGAAPATMPLSLTRTATVASVLATIPGVAAALLVLRGPADNPRVPVTIVVVALLSVVVGIAQVTGGNSSPFYIYDTTNEGQAVGLFSNKNHLATLALVTIPCLAFLHGAEPLRGTRGAGGRGRSIALAAAAAFVLFGILMSGSDAGLLLAGPTAIASLLVARNTRLGLVHLLGFAVLVIGLLVAATVFNDKVGALLTFGPDQPLDRRYFWNGTVRLIAQSLPFGTGLGSFADIYRTIEDPATVVPIFVNHAHNDYLEIALEVGVAGIVATLVFLAWWCWRVVAAWRSSSSLAKTASVVTAVMLVHSTVDYPIRTAAMMAIFAAACAILARPFTADEERPAAIRSRRGR